MYRETRSHDAKVGICKQVGNDKQVLSLDINVIIKKLTERTTLGREFQGVEPVSMKT